MVKFEVLTVIIEINAAINWHQQKKIEVVFGRTKKVFSGLNSCV